MSNDNEGPVIDLTRYHAKREVGEWLCYITWYGAKLDDSEPCIVIVPRARNYYRPAVICLSSAFKYSEPGYLVQAAMAFNRTLGGTDNAATVHKLADLIHSSLRDLIVCPPKPVSDTRHVAEATITLESGKAKTFELTEDV